MAEVVLESVSSAESAPSTTEATKMDDATLLEQMEKAKKQVEFYFADSNLPYDKFMWTLYSKDPDHWIPIPTVASFKRMREYAKHGPEWLLNALRLSTFLEVDETGTKVRRTTEPQEAKDAFQRSVYAKGFPDEDSELQRKLEDFFNQYGLINSVRMRRDEHKKFKNSVFTEFTDFPSVESFLKAEPKPAFEDKELIIMSKEAYCDMKIEEKGLSGKSANHRREVMSKGRGFDAFREMAKGKSSSQKTNSAEPPKEVFLEFMGNKLPIKRDEEGNGTIDEKDIPFVKGGTLKFEGCGGDVAWSEIKDPIKAKFDGKSPFIKYSRGDDHGLVGFHKILTEEEIASVKDAIKTINKREVTWTIPTDDEEKQFQIERAQTAARSALSQHSHSRGRGREGKSGRGGRGGRGGGGRGGGGRGGRGGMGKRAGPGDRNAEAKAKADTGGEPEMGEKRKRAVEPDGGPLVGVRGLAAPPILAVKRVKTGDGDSTPASSSS